MTTQETIRQIRRRLHEAQHGSTQDKVLARQSYAEDVGALLTLLEVSAIGLAMEENSRLEVVNADLRAKLEGFRRAEEREVAPIAPRVRMKQSPLFVPRDGKMLAAGKDN